MQNTSKSAGGKSDSIKFAEWQWREINKSLAEMGKGAVNPGAGVLSFYRDQMVATAGRLLNLGLDISDHHNPTVVPVPVARRPKTNAEVRRMEAEIGFRISQYMLSFAVTAAGTHVIFSDVSKEALAAALAPYIENPHELTRATILDALSRSNLEILALACVIWLMEPAGLEMNRRDELAVAAFQRMQYAMETATLSRVAAQAKGSGSKTEPEKLAASNALAGWSLPNVSRKGQAGGRLRQALGAGASDKVQDARLLEELPAATQIAWEDWRPEEPLRSDGSGNKSLARRVAALIESGAHEAAMHPGKVNEDTQSGEGYIGSEDPALEEFELKESVRQDLSRLEVWVEKANLSEGEQRVYELDMRTDHDTAAISRQLQVDPVTVRQFRKRYRDKLRQAAGL